MSRRSALAVALPAADFAAAIAERAYFLAERRGFAPGHELEDWLAAERELGTLAMTRPTAALPKRPMPKRKTGTASKAK